ncbi:hypothetical protein C8J57DRAFT_1577834 [Mycena rebaudengoi]|nr:hypothetical protein C8J57DRAFT_1577834 [Mycena rebaudengoi]
MPSNNLDSDSDSDDGRRVNDDLPHKLADVARTFQRKLAKQEAESEGLQVKLEETCNELSVAKCEEEELRIKERQNSAQIEEERQYTDRCALAEKYRDDLREREETKHQFFPTR